MSVLPAGSIFIRQNVWLRLAILIIGSVVAIGVPPIVLGVFAGWTALYFLLSPAIYGQVLQGMRRLLPFAAAYGVFALLSGLDIVTILLFLARITGLLLLMVFFSASLQLSRLMQDCRWMQRHRLTGMLLYLAVATLLFIKRFMACYHRHTGHNKRQKQSLNHYLMLIVTTIADNWQARAEVEDETHRLLSYHYSRQAWSTQANVLGAIYLTGLVLLLSL